MKTKLTPIIIGRAALLLLLSILNYEPSTWAQGTAFSYQGLLNDGGSPANGNYDLRFAIYDAASGGSQQGLILTNSATAVSNGLFTVALDFGNQFPGAARWLEISVRTNGALSFFTLIPRQALTPAPYAITAGNVRSGGLNGLYTNAITFSNPANSFSGGGAGLTSLNASQLTGGAVPLAALSNAWTIAGNRGANPTNGAFLGTPDNLPLELKVNGARALRLEPNPNGAPNVIGGAPVNFVAPGVIGAVIAGGGVTNYFGSAATNSVLADFGTIGGGYGNTIQTTAAASTIGGGEVNAIETSAFVSTIGGGEFNTIQTNAYESTIGGGYANTIQIGTSLSTIGGGEENTIQTNAYGSTIGGGYLNAIQTNAFYSTIGGGVENKIQTSSYGSTIGGGYANTIQTNAFYSTIGGGLQNSAKGAYSTVPGGVNNSASGDRSFAAGDGALAAHYGSFVWADASGGFFSSTANNQFSVRASGGLMLAGDISFSGDSRYHNLSLSGGNSVGYLYGSYPALADGIHLGYNWYADNSGAGHVLNHSGATSRITAGYGFIDLAVGNVNTAPSTVMLHVGTSGVCVNGTISNCSDRNVKQDFAPVNPTQILERVLQLPMSVWSYKLDPATRHIGPMAQDFYGAFNVGMDDKHIATIDESGVALAAIQGLNEKVEDRYQRSEVRSNKSEERIERLEAENAELKNQLRELKQLLMKLSWKDQIERRSL